jgi:hypothetical protein
MIYSAQSADWKYQAKEKFRQVKQGTQRFPRFKQLLIFICTLLFFWLIGIWFKSNFERIEQENEVYLLKREIQMHFLDFLAEFGKSYPDEQTYKQREANYIKNYMLIRH